MAILIPGTHRVSIAVLLSKPVHNFSCYGVWNIESHTALDCLVHKISFRKILLGAPLSPKHILILLIQKQWCQIKLLVVVFNKIPNFSFINKDMGAGVKACQPREAEKHPVHLPPQLMSPKGSFLSQCHLKTNLKLNIPPFYFL